MNYSFLGSTGVKVSRLCFGTMAFGGKADRDAARSMFAAAIDAGVNFFDTANVYNSGASEEILGELIRERRDEVVVATKAYFPTSLSVNARGSSRYHLVRAVDDSLRRLGTDRIDVLYLHRYDDDTDLEDTLRTLDDLVRAGKILYPAASNFSAWQIAKALGIAERRGYAPFACMQPMYNLVKRQAEVELFELALAEKLGVVSYSPTGGGLLSGRYSAKQTPTSGRIVDTPMYAVRYGNERHYEVADAFVAIATREGVHPVTLAVAWVAAHPAVTAPIIGGRNLEQIKPSLAAVDFELGPELYAEVAQLWPAPPPATDRNEEGTGADYSSTLQRKKSGSSSESSASE